MIGGQGTTDLLVGPDVDAEWHITGENSGTVLGITFSSFENLTGSANNEDAFIFRAGGSLTGLLDGGVGGLDSFAIENPSADQSLPPTVLTAIVPDGTGAGELFFSTVYNTYPSDRKVIYQGMEPYFQNTGSGTDVVITTSLFSETLILENNPNNPDQVRLRTISAELDTPFGSVEFWNPVLDEIIGPLVFDVPNGTGLGINFTNIENLIGNVGDDAGALGHFLGRYFPLHTKGLFH